MKTSTRVLANLAFFAVVFSYMVFWAVQNVVTVDAVERPYEITGEFAAASGVALSSDDAVLAPGTYSVAGLLGGGAGASLSVGATGRLTSYVPLGSLPPLTARLFELSRVQ